MNYEYPVSEIDFDVSTRQRAELVRTWRSGPLLRGLVCFLTLTALLSAGRAGEPQAGVRLALVGEPACLPLVDLLTAALGKDSGYQLLERAQIERVLEEQRSGGRGSAGQYLALGRLLGAQALLVIGEEALQGRTMVAWRLLATGPGVVVASGWQPRTGLDTDAWLKSMQARLARVKDKVVVPGSNAVPISLSRIRYAAAAKDSDIQERTFNHLLRQRLMAEPRLFVLERWRLDELRWEKELAQDQQTFWTGGYVLEGQLEPDIATPENLTLRLSLTSSQKQLSVSMMLKVAANHWTEAVERIAPWVAEATAAGVPGTAWSAPTEAELFYTEALAAEQAGMFDEARELIEAACGLGRDDVETQKNRIRIYCRLLEGGDFRQLSGRGSTPMLGVHVAPMVETSTNSSQRLMFAVRTMELYLTLMEHPPGVANPRNTTELLFFIAPSHVLSEIHYQRDARLRDDPAVATLRQLLRAAAQRHEIIGRDRSCMRYYYYIKSAYGPLWMETPEEGAALLRRTFEAYGRCNPPDDWMFTVYFENCHGLATWRAGDKTREAVVMRTLAGELQQSTQCVVRLAGRIIEYQWAENEQKQLRMLAEEPEALRKSRGADIIASINHGRWDDSSDASMGYYFLNSYAKNRPVPVDFMIRLLKHSLKPELLNIYQTSMPKSRSGGLSAAEQAQLRPAVENFLARAAASDRTVKEKDQAYYLAEAFSRMDPIFRLPTPPLDAMALAAPRTLPDGGQCRGVFWENGHLFAVTGSSPPRLYEIAPDDAGAPAGGWPPPWNGVVPLTSEVDANADWLIMGDFWKQTTWLLDRRRGTWRSRPQNHGSPPVLALVGSNQWSTLVPGEISAIDVQTGTRELKFSHRRKGGASPLEGCSPYVVKKLQRHGPHHLLVEVVFLLPGYPGDKETAALFLVDLRDSSVQTLLRGLPNYEAGSWILGFNPDWLSQIPKNTPPIFAVDPLTGIQTPLLSPRMPPKGIVSPTAVWATPEDLRLPYFYKEFPVYYDGQRMMFFGGTSARLGSRCMLWVFDKDQATGRPMPWAHPTRPSEGREQFDAVRDNDPLRGYFMPYYCPRGILLWSSSTNFYFVTMTDINRYLQAHPAPAPSSPATASRPDEKK
ncbi:MAG: hypothetical protein NTV49_11780 [Kiritimatiellaeota bacterium]|nr:hypothetical protein [Kiritimatiellota bacterium]